MADPDDIDEIEGDAPAPSPAPTSAVSVFDGSDDESDTDATDVGVDGENHGSGGDGGDRSSRDSALPSHADGYRLTGIDGHEWAEADHTAFRAFADIAVQHRLSQDAVDGVTGWYAGLMKSLRERDVADATALREELETRSGADVLSGDVKLVRGFLGSLGDLGDEIKNARSASGQRLINNQEFFRLLRGLARGRFGTPATHREAEIRHILATDKTRYDRENLGVELETIIRKKSGDGASQPSRALRDTRTGREREIERIRSEDVNRYYREKLDEELLQIRRKRAG